MLNVKVRVPESRDRTAVVEIRSGLSNAIYGSAVASASAELAARHGNPQCDPLRPWGHPPFGSYRLLARGPAPAGCELEYGGHLLVFQPESGEALEAESLGRLLLLAYAGPASKSGQLRPTQGGLRLEQNTFDALLEALAAQPQALLEIEALRPPAWWQFWKHAMPTVTIAADTPRLSAPPLDEASLAALISAGRRLPHDSGRRQDREWSDSGGTGSSSGSSSSDRTEFSGKGGEFAGGGASGAWGGAAGGGRAVDSAGRITAAAAGAALAAGAIDAGADSASPQVGGESSGGGDVGGDTGTQTSTGY